MTYNCFFFFFEIWNTFIFLNILKDFIFCSLCYNCFFTNDKPAPSLILLHPKISSFSAAKLFLFSSNIQSRTGPYFLKLFLVVTHYELKFYHNHPKLLLIKMVYSSPDTYSNSINLTGFLPWLCSWWPSAGRHQQNQIALRKKRSLCKYENWCKTGSF